MASRKLIVEIVGDSRSLDRALKKSTKNAQTFSGQMDKSARSVQAFSRGIVGGFAGAAAFNVLISGLKDVVALAAESQQVLGQTSVAVRSAGISWDEYGKSIESAIDAQSKFGFDDEALLRTFSLFIRTAGSVDEALRRNQIAMDLARARFIDLEQAATLVNKAALGQAGALRRVGINARNGASGVQLLAQLEREFGGAAQAASGDAATAMERFQVSVENAKEAIGSKLLPALTTLTNDITNVVNGLSDIRDAVNDLNGFVAEIGINIKVGISGSRLALNALKQIVPGLGPLSQAIGALRQRSRENQPAPLVQGERGGPSVARDRPIPAAAGAAGRKGITAAQRNQWFDAKIARELNRLQDLSLRKQLARLKAIAQEIRARLAVTKDATRRLTLEDTLLDVMREQRAVQEGIADNAKKATDAIKEANEALKDRADAIKSAVIERLQRRQTDILNKRALQDAQEALRIARQIGGPKGIQNALRNLQDVQFDILRARIENAPASLTRGGQFALGGVVTINIHGITDPDQVAAKVAAILQKRGRRTTTQTRGSASGSTAGAH